MLFKNVDNIKQEQSVNSPLTDTTVKKETRVVTPCCYVYLGVSTIVL